MKLLTTCIGLAIAAAGSGAWAQTPPATPALALVNEAARICLSADGDVAKATTTATGLGYAPVARDAMPFMEGFQNLQALSKGADANAYTLIFGDVEQSFMGRTQEWSVCAVSTRAVEQEAVERTLRERLGGQEPVGGGDEGNSYAWSLENGARIPIIRLNERRARALQRAGTIRQFVTYRQGGASYVAFYVPKRD